MKLCALAVVGAALSATANAQSFTDDSTITLALHWSELGGNGDGVLEPGESALLSMDMSFTNQGGVADFSPPIGAFSSGTVVAFASAVLDINGTGSTQGGWDTHASHGFGVDPMWAFFGRNGTPANNGANLTDIEMGQFGEPANLNTANPVQPIWTGVWTPSSFAARTVSFSVAAPFNSGNEVAAVYVGVSDSIGFAVYPNPSHLDLGSVQISIAPASPVASVLGLVILGRRRRR